MIHPSEDELETYILGGPIGLRPDGDDATRAVIEEHLFICDMCLEWTQAQEQTIGIMLDCLPWPIPKTPRIPRVNDLATAQGWLF